MQQLAERAGLTSASGFVPAYAEAHGSRPFDAHPLLSHQRVYGPGLVQQGISGIYRHEVIHVLGIGKRLLAEIGALGQEVIIGDGIGQSFEALSGGCHIR